MALVALLASPLFRTVITGAGFFGDSYDLFVTDGVTAILKNLGPVTRVRYTYYSGNTTQTLDSYFSAYCTSGVKCLPRLYDNTTSTWVPNPSTVWTPEMTPRYQQQTTDLKNGVSNAALIGSVLGQLAFGVGGDWVGRKWCFFLTSSLIILGCLGSAASSGGSVVGGRLNAAGAWGDTTASPSSVANDVYLQLSLWRFVLGFGVGGEYPLAGAIASEGAKSTEARGKSVLFTFSMQGWGKLTAALVNYALVGQLRYFGGPWALDDAWRFALAFGCVLNVLTLPFRWMMEESEIFKKRSKGGVGEGGESSSSSGSGSGISSGGSDESTLTFNPLKGGGGNHNHHHHHHTSSGALEWGATPSSSSASTAAVVVVEKPRPSTPNPSPTTPTSSSPFWASLRVTLTLLYLYRWTLVGTAGTWFLIDVTFYGQSLMNTAVVSEAVASTGGLNAMDKLRSSLLSTVWIMLIAIPGYFIAIWLVDLMGRKKLQTGGFLAVAAVFFVLGGAYDTPLRTGGGGAGFVLLYGLTYLFSNAGPNSVTFLLPAESFPTLIRATAHGISAAAGKIGATVGAFGLLELYSSFCLSQIDATGKPNCGASSSPTPSQMDEMSRGVVAVMYTCGAVAVAGAVVTVVFCKETLGVSLKEVDEETERQVMALQRQGS